MAALTLLMAALAASAVANPVPDPAPAPDAGSRNLTTYRRPLGTDMPTFDVDAVAKTFTVPAVDASVFSQEHINSRSTSEPANNNNKLARRWDINKIACLEPAIGVVSEDCEMLCNELAVASQSLILDPLNIFYWEYGHCQLGLANLDPCGRLGFSEDEIQPYCQSMYTGCLVDGFDGFLAGDNPLMAMALTGLESAPPYEPGVGSC